MDRYATNFATVGRIVIAAIFIVSGLGRIAAPEATQGYIASVGLPFPLLGYIIALATSLSFDTRRQLR
ncbi:DoxX family protein [Cedecea davisae]|uniref:DoxX family protein n=1 Tax=Cedecea davisae TaxID=158484 RepID=UPI00242D69B9|nr:DoxX family membrane protein [Cedecea davisae]